MNQSYNVIFSREDAIPVRLPFNRVDSFHNVPASFPPYDTDGSLMTGGSNSYRDSTPFDYSMSTVLPRRSSMEEHSFITEFLPQLEQSQSLTDEEKTSAKERRRTQNRFAQRAYRQRKEQAIRDQEKEIETLRMQLAKEKKLNQSLSKVIEFLKHKLKAKQPESSSDNTVDSTKS